MSCWYEGSPLTAMRTAGVAMTRVKRAWMQDVGREWMKGVWNVSESNEE